MPKRQAGSVLLPRIHLGGEVRTIPFCREAAPGSGTEPPAAVTDPEPTILQKKSLRARLCM